jgi:hypothetical protein
VLDVMMDEGVNGDRARDVIASSCAKISVLNASDLSIRFRTRGRKVLESQDLHVS